MPHTAENIKNIVFGIIATVLGGCLVAFFTMYITGKENDKKEQARQILELEKYMMA